MNPRIAIRWCVLKSIQNDFIWHLFGKRFQTLGPWVSMERNAELYRRKESALRLKLFPELVVQSGPFEGLQYPSAKSICSSLMPKLIGSYERELTHRFNEFLQNAYEVIVDIGSAEGYYAVGLARCFPGVPVIAFDLDEKARRLCQTMAEVNDVDKQLQMRAFCDEHELSNLVTGRRALIICDCEGYESQLFTTQNHASLFASDLCIELHEHAVPGVTERLMNVFSESHDCQLVRSIPDVEKPLKWSHEISDALDLADREIVLSEHRPAGMEWLVLSSRESSIGIHSVSHQNIASKN